MLCRLLCLLLFLAWTAEGSNDTGLYSGHWRSAFALLAPLFTSIPGINLWAWQILMLVLALVGLLRPGGLRRRSWVMDVAVLVSFASVAVTFLWGWLRGGSAYNAYYQLWRFLLALLVGLLLPAVVRGSRDLRAIGWTIVAAAVTRATLAAYFYWVHARGKIDPIPDFMTSHEDSLLFVAALVVVLSWALARRSMLAWIAAAAVSGHVLYAMVLNDRRLAWVELVLALLPLYLLLPPRGMLRRRVTQFAVLATPLVLAYVAVGWGRSGMLFAPVQALSTVLTGTDASSLARQEEIRNLLHTFVAARNPLLGTGWGVEYQKVTTVFANFGPEMWWQYRYLPHNSLLGLAAFSGLVGLFGIWMVIPVAAFLATLSYREATHPTERAAAMAAVCILPAYSAQCYGDIGLQSFTCGLILGVAIGVANKVSALTAAQQRAGRAARRSPTALSQPSSSALTPAARASQPLPARR